MPNTSCMHQKQSACCSAQTHGNVREQVSRLFGAYRRKSFPVYFRVHSHAPFFSSAQASEAGPCTWGGEPMHCRWLHIRDMQGGVAASCSCAGVCETRNLPALTRGDQVGSVQGGIAWRCCPRGVASPCAMRCQRSYGRASPSLPVLCWVRRCSAASPFPCIRSLNLACVHAGMQDV